MNGQTKESLTAVRYWIQKNVDSLKVEIEKTQTKENAIMMSGKIKAHLDVIGYINGRYLEKQGKKEL